MLERSTVAASAPLRDRLSGLCSRWAPTLRQEPLRVGKRASQVVLDVELIRGSDDRDLEADAHAEFAECLAEPVVVHAQARIPDQMPTACLVIAPVLAGTHAFEEVHAVAAASAGAAQEARGRDPRRR